MYFIFDGTSSKEFNIKIKKNGINNLSSPQRSYESKAINGRNGEILIDNLSYENFTLNIKCCIDARKTNIIEVSRYLKKWLQTDLDYKKLILSCEQDFYYEATCINKLDIEKVFRNFGECVISFSCKPYKRKANVSNIEMIKPSTINNNFMDSSMKLEIFGKGDMTLYFNNQTINLKDVADKVIIDSEEYDCYTLDSNGIRTSFNHRMKGDFPILEEGINNINWVGKIDKLAIYPNWVVL